VRIYKDFREAMSEIKRDLAEMGVGVQNRMMQDKVGDFPTLEVQNYGYTVLNPDPDELNINAAWCTAEWSERRSGCLGNAANPGEAYHLRKDEHINWEDFLEVGGVPVPHKSTVDQLIKDKPHLAGLPAMFAYSYAERFARNHQVQRVIAELRRNPMSRQLYVAMWDPNEDAHRLGANRVPCSIGWHFLYREGRLDITYTMRSCDFITHFQHDVWMSMQLLIFVANYADIPIGRFHHFINSLHIYKSDVEGVF
jgi:hypothetical protein